MQFKPKYRMYLSVLLKSALAVLTLGFLYKELFLESDFRNAWQHLQQLPDKQAPVILLVTLLMFLNWGIETWKWKRLVAPLEQLPFYKAFLAIFTGITVSVVTPNRIGEYAGRVLFLERGERVQAIFSTIVGSLSQLTVTLLLGALGLPVLGFEAPWTLPLLIVALLLSAGFLLFYFRVGVVPVWLQQMKAPASWIRVTGILSRYSTAELWSTLLLSVLRYGVFTLQLLLLWEAIGVFPGWIKGIQAAGAIFLIQTLIPSFALAELGVRGATAVMVMEPLTHQPVEVVAASYLLWFINLVIPAFIGLLSLWFARIFKT